MKGMTFAFDAESRREAVPRSFLTVFAILAAFVLLTPATGCKPKKSSVEYGGGQIATAQEREKQYEKLVEQVVLAAEAQEKYPDLTYLRGALGRLDTWLAEKPKPADFSPDPEYDELAREFTELVATVKKCEELFALFADVSKSVEEKDCDELETAIKSFKAQIAPLVSKTSSATLGAFELFADEALNLLADAREIQFKDPTESFRDRISQLASSPSYPYYNFATLRAGLEDYLRLLKIDGTVFLPQDADYLRSAVWLRDVLNWAKGPKQDDLTVVKSLFDWTVKNVVLSEPLPTPMGLVSQLEWQTLLLGQGTPMDRAIVFIELLRQHKLDAFVVRPDGELRDGFPLVVGVCCDDKVYLFDVALGLPFAAAGDVALADKAGLVVNKVATLRDVAEDDSILRRFDLPARPYAATSEDFKRVVAYVPSTPFQVSSRMIPLEQGFSGNVNTVLTTPFDAKDSQRERIAKLNGIVGVERLQEANAPILEQTIFPEESDFITRAFMTPMETAKSLEVNASSESGSADEINDYTGDSSEQFAGVSGKRQTHLTPLWIGRILYLRGDFVNEGAARWLLQGRVSERILKSQVSRVRTLVAQYQKEFVEWEKRLENTSGDGVLKGQESDALTQFAEYLKDCVKWAKKLGHAPSDDELKAKEPETQKLVMEHLGALVDFAKELGYAPSDDELWRIAAEAASTFKIELKECVARTKELGQTPSDEDLLKIVVETANALKTNNALVLPPRILALTLTAKSLQTEIALKRFIKVVTSYNLALLSEETGADAAALERLNDDSLRPSQRANAQERIGDEYPNAANYLRARILEKQASWAAAAARLRAGLDFGSKVRAKWIAELAGLDLEETDAGNAEVEEPTSATPETEATPASDVSDAQEPVVEEPSAEAFSSETQSPADSTAEASALAPAPEDSLDATDGESAKEIAVPEESAVNKSAAEETTPDASPSDPSQP